MIRILGLEEHKKYSKFIQLYISKEPILTFGDMGEIHATILERTLNTFELKFEKMRISEFDDRLIPKPEGENYELVGAGKVSSLLKNEFDFYDISIHYRRGTDIKHLIAIKPFLPDGAKITCGDRII